MSYFKQIASRARPTNPGRSQSLPLLNPTQALFRPATLVQPLELADEHLGSDESGMLGSPQASTIASVTQPSSPPATGASPSDSSDVLFPSHLPLTPLSTRSPQAITPTTGLSLPPGEQNPPDAQPATPASPAPAQVSLSLSDSPDLQRDAPQLLVPIIPVRYLGADPLPSVERPVEKTKSLGDQATVDAVSATNLTPIKAIAQPLRTTLEPKHSAEMLPMERIAESPSQLPPPSLPGLSKPDRAQRSTIHIGAIDIQITPPPVKPQTQPLTTRSVATTTTGSLSRGFASGFGLRQG
jgi:hypothetical protein